MRSAIEVVVRAIERFKIEVDAATRASHGLFAVWFAWRWREQQRLLSVLRQIRDQRDSGR